MSYRILVVSDLHVSQGPSLTDNESRISSASTTLDLTSDPLLSLIQLARDMAPFDAIVCPGDITNKANPTCQLYGWNRLQELKRRTRAKKLIAVPGNHDTDSRYGYDEDDARRSLRGLDPRLPVPEEGPATAFWANHFVIYRHKNVRYLIVDSTAYHGGGKDQADEREHGAISTDTIRAIADEIKKDKKPAALNVLVTHHHLFRFNEIGEDDISEMKNGDALLRSVLSDGRNLWLAIHGHRHTPHLIQAPGTNSAPIIFCAGSIGSKRLRQSPPVRNQFHIVTIPIGSPDFDELGVCGTVETWDWADGYGWAPATGTASLPYTVGFGARVGITQLSHEIEDTLVRSGAPLQAWQEILQALPKLKYVLHDDLSQAMDLIAGRIGLRVQRDEYGQPNQLEIGAHGR